MKEELIFIIIGTLVGIAIMYYGATTANYLALMLGTFIVFNIFPLGLKLKTNVENHRISEIKEEYTVYLDGNEVDADKIDFGQYQYTINDEAKEIYMTYK